MLCTCILFSFFESVRCFDLVDNSYCHVMDRKTPLVTPFCDEEIISRKTRLKRVFLCIFPVLFIVLACVCLRLYALYFIRPRYDMPYLC